MSLFTKCENRRYWLSNIFLTMVLGSVLEVLFVTNTSMRKTHAVWRFCRPWLSGYTRINSFTNFSYSRRIRRVAENGDCQFGDCRRCGQGFSVASNTAESDRLFRRFTTLLMKLYFRNSVIKSFELSVFQKSQLTAPSGTYVHGDRGFESACRIFIFYRAMLRRAQFMRQ